MTRYNDEPAPNSDKPWVQGLVNRIAIVGFSTYAIVALEQTISRSHLDVEEKDWTLGRILAVCMLFGVGNELLNLFLDRKAKEDGRIPSGGQELAPAAP